MNVKPHFCDFKFFNYNIQFITEILIRRVTFEDLKGWREERNIKRNYWGLLTLHIWQWNFKLMVRLIILKFVKVKQFNQ